MASATGCNQTLDFFVELEAAVRTGQALTAA